ncbi:hypothetical protein GGP46_002992 [Salinibacter ruber]|nr:hypothetical protein [Salinibacter ruber]
MEGPLDPLGGNFNSNRCRAEDVKEETVQGLRAQFYKAAINLNMILSDPSPVFAASRLWERVVSKMATIGLGQLSKLSKPSSIRFLEKTPKNSLRVSFMNRIFPDALFVWNRRAPKPNIDSLIDGWHTIDEIGPFTFNRFSRAGYPIVDQLDLQDYPGEMWNFALVPQWRSLKGRTIGEVAAWQYYQCERCASDDLNELENDRVIEVRHEDFIQRPLELTSKILSRAGLSVETVVEQFASELPQVNATSESNRAHNSQLRHPKQVRRGMQMIPDERSVR